MSHGERQGWQGAAATVAAPPPKGSTGAVAALDAMAAPEAAVGAAPQWELLYRTVSRAQKADVLTLASQHGLLKKSQLPFVPSPHSMPPAEPSTWNVLSKLLTGQKSQLHAVVPKQVEVLDTALDDVQRYAVACALTTPDLCLIQGLPGTGKSRVAAEIIRQAAERGDRILLLAAHAAALDRILEVVASADNLCPIRCLAPEEQVGQLPPAIRALTLPERAVAVRGNTLQTARQTRQAAELQCARRRHEASLWPQLEELVRLLAAARTALAQAQAKLADVESEVANEARAATGRLADDLRGLERRGEELLAKLANEVKVAETQRDHDLQAYEELRGQSAAIEPLAAAKRARRWWSPKWWKATWRGNVVGQALHLQEQLQQIEAAVQAQDLRVQGILQSQRSAAEKTAADIEARLEKERGGRQHKLLAAIQRHQDQIERHEVLWSDLCRQLDDETLCPRALTCEAVEAARAQWHERRQEDETRCAFARDWAEFLESSSVSLAAKLPGFANLVAATPAALAADPHFGDAAAGGGQFDVLVLDEANLLTENEFLRAVRRAQKLVLLGEPALCADRPSHTPTRAGSVSGRRQESAEKGELVQCFHQLWEHLHCDPRSLPHAWFHEGPRLGCRMRLVAPEQRKWLESEPLADALDVELRILALPRSRPVLAEVMFPAGITVPKAKEFLFRELQEITVQTTGRGARWSETPQATVITFTDAGGQAQEVKLDHGVSEFLDGPHLDHTCRLEFDRGAGWDRSTIEQWLEQHLPLHDLGRTAYLDKPQRMTRGLAEVVMDLIGAGDCGHLQPAGESAEPVVEFVPVVGTGKNKSAGRGDVRNARKVGPAAASLPSIGAGLEIDLAGLRPGDRLVDELRPLVPGRGFVNLPEARAVVRKLEQLVRTGEQNPPAAGSSVGAVAVIALSAAQAELIRRLMQQSALLAAHAASIVVGPPAALRQREADVVVVSLTRSHSHRAVAYSESPAAVVQALTRARRQLVLVGDPGGLVRRSQWRGVLDHLDEAAANREAQLLGQLVRYLQGRGRHQRLFRVYEGGTT